MSTKKLTQEIFINRCREIHGNKFNYSSSVYKNMNEKVEIGCYSCGNFWNVSPGNHIGLKSGCPFCKISNQIQRNKDSSLSTLEFITRSNARHNFKFDYSKTEYINSKTKVKIICPTHGEFEQWPQDHMRGIGCLSCSGVKKKTTDEFIIEAKKLFPHFDYSLVDYVNAHAPIKIICPTHGKFLQKPNAILNNVGCEKCSIDRMLQTKIERGIITDPKDKTDYENYRRKVWRISNQQYKLYKDKVNPENHPRSLKYHLDHKYPIQQGWVNGKTAEEIGNWTNLQILEGIANRKKGNKII